MAKVNPENPKENIEEELQSLQEIVNHSQYIIDGLQGNTAWEEVLKDFQQERQRLDDNWQYVSDPAKMNEWRVTKMAVMKIINMLADYEQDKLRALAEIQALKNPDKEIIRDYDNE